MNELEFHCSILGVKPGASEREVKKAYRELAQILHPDKHNGSEVAANKFKQLQAAYEFISMHKLVIPSKSESKETEQQREEEENSRQSPSHKEKKHTAFEEQLSAMGIRLDDPVVDTEYRSAASGSKQQRKAPREYSEAVQIRKMGEKSRSLFGVAIRVGVGLLLMKLIAVARAEEPENWFCKENASQRRGNSIYSCGVGLGKDENEARVRAFDNATAEFSKVCHASDDCNGHEISADPKRTTCAPDGRDKFKCYRLVVFAIGRLTDKALVLDQLSLPEISKIKNSENPPVSKNLDLSLVGQWQSKCSTVFNEGKDCGVDGFFKTTFYPSGFFTQIYFPPTDSKGDVATEKGDWSTEGGKLGMNSKQASYSPSGALVHKNELNTLVYSIKGHLPRRPEKTNRAQLEMKLLETKDYDSTGFATVTNFDLTPQNPVILIKVNDISK